MNYRYWATNFTGKIFLCNNVSTLIQACVRWTHLDEQLDSDPTVGYVYHITELEDTNIDENYMRAYSGVVAILDDETGQATAVL